jgi:hypothetical protein
MVVSTSGNNQITLGTVQFAHAAQAKAAVGRVITEDRNCPSKRSIERIAKWPIVKVVSLLARYAYGRRSDQVGGLNQEMNLLAAVQTFGCPLQWIPIPIAQSCGRTRQTKSGCRPVLMAYYSDVCGRYVAGYPTAPDPVVRVTAKIAADLNAKSGIAGQIFSAGDTRIQKFSAATIDDDVKALIEPYRARTMF